MIDDRTEWLEADGLGGFASGTTSGIRTRRYHALLLTATTPPTGRFVLVNGFDAWIVTPGGRVSLSSQRYAPDVVHPDGANRIGGFTADPWPTWTFVIPRVGTVIQELLVERATGRTIVTWTIDAARGPVDLFVRPFLSGRDYHAMHRENPGFGFEPSRENAAVVFQVYPGLPAVVFESDGDYAHEPDWYRNFLYTAERERGLDDLEDLASPGVFQWRLSKDRPSATWMIGAGRRTDMPRSADDAAVLGSRLLDRERMRRASFRSPLDRSGDAYVVTRGHGQTIVAGYPWFTDWGRDTFIALRGLCLASGRYAVARDILVEWASTVSEGMLPNRFPDGSGPPEFNSVDASLWYVVAVGELLRVDPSALGVSDTTRTTLESAVEQIVSGYAAGTRYGIRMETDGLLAAGVSGQQLTWMDARIGDWVVTPRIGKPVEIQALWLNAVAVAARAQGRWADVLARGRAAFVERFWCERGFLADVVDVDHRPGARDETFRPNQIFAVGGLPLPLLDGERARHVVDAVEDRLLTPLGLRSLAPGEAGYTPRYEGGPAARDAVYHQGTVWPWLLGPFVEAWVRVRGNTEAAKREARARFIGPVLEHLARAGLGHVSEIADAEPPFTPRGCPFQAWSLGEVIRLDRAVLAKRPRRTSADLNRRRVEAAPSGRHRVVAARIPRHKGSL